MTRCIGWLGLALFVMLGALPLDIPASDHDWHLWRLLPVQDGGRIKPLDSLARDTLRRMTGRESIPDPETGEQLEPVAAYLMLVLEWQGWDGPAPSGAGHPQHPANPYFGRHTGDAWDQLPLLPVPYADLRELLDLPRGSHAIAPYALSQAKIAVPESHEPRPFVTWAERLGKTNVDRRTVLERHAWELMQRYGDYQRHRMGERWLVTPPNDGSQSRWLSLSEIVSARVDESSDPSGKLRAVQQSFAAARQSFHGASFEAQVTALKAFHKALSGLNVLDENSAQMTVLRWEVWNNHWRPFRWSWICLALSALGLGFSAGTVRRRLRWCGWGLYVGGCLAMCVGVAVRMMVSGRWLGASMYESVVLVAAGVVVLGLLGSFMERDRLCLVAGALTGALMFVLVDVWTIVLDPTLQPLPLALQHTPWFLAHGLTTSLGFAFLALSAALSNIQLGLFWNRTASHSLGPQTLRLMERTAQWGVVWLTAGLVTGALWAERAWGRFWEWDAKQNWTLIALLAYLAAQHVRSAGWVQTYAKAAINTICFQLVLVAWYGMNCVAQSGRHDFGFVPGSIAWLVIVIAVQLLLIVAAGVTVARQAYQAREERRLGTPS